VALPVGLPEDNLIAADWASFLQGWRDPETGLMHQAPVESLRIHSIDNLFRDHLREAHGSLAQVNAALGSASADWLDILPPQQDFLHEHWLSPRKARLRLEFCVRNFITVLDYVLLHGRAVFNTIVFVALTILCSLVVNPLAAYALSRYRPPSSYKILLFLMLTMAFPPMVTQIPAFLMLREFNLLNTFAALILPGMASGYSIFLLKGFFDSLPQELYESAAIDGAGEIRIFLQITMSLSKPILAVIALGAFNGAYGNFMMALLICQDQKMWTLMPWLYQLQMRSSQGLVFASLVIAAIPTFLIFSLCQNVIMRGIVVPVEK
jgi:multiple sugar transport system permease protein